MDPRDEFVSWLGELMALSDAASDDLAASITQAAQIAAAVTASSHPGRLQTLPSPLATQLAVRMASHLEDRTFSSHGATMSRPTRAAASGVQCRVAGRR